MYSVAFSSTHRIVIGGLITPIARLVSVELNPNDRVAGSKWLNLAVFEQMTFVRLMVGVLVGFILGTAYTSQIALLS